MIGILAELTAAHRQTGRHQDCLENSMNKKILSAAVLAGLAALGAVGAAEAVHINPDGLGQVLIFPYYTVNAGQFTTLSVVNSQNNTKLVKVRFLEGKNGREVMDFNLFLAPADMWAGAVVATAEGARIITNDNSCVTPSDLFAETRVDTLNLPFNAFKNYNYTSSMEDNAIFASLDRTREGYVEVIEMGVIDDDLITGNAMTAGNTAALVTSFVKSNAAGVPANCAALNAFDAFEGNQAAIQFPNKGSVGTLLQPPRGGLYGRASVINPTTGANYTFSPTAIDAWSATVQYSVAGSSLPELSAANPRVSNILTSNGILTATWADGRDAMSAALMRNTITNEFILDAGNQAQSDWIITFPTKRYYVPARQGPALRSDPPFENSTRSAILNYGVRVGDITLACDRYSFAVFNREEGFPAPVVSTLPLPPEIPPTTTAAGATLCWQANIVPFAGSSSMLASTNTNPLIAGLQDFILRATSEPADSTTPSLRGRQGPNGRFSMTFNMDIQGLTPMAATLTALGITEAPVAVMPPPRHNGMPVIGAMVHMYRNTGVASRYGGVIEHTYTRKINP